MIFDLESIKEVIKATEIGAKKDNKNLWSNSDELEKYMKTSAGLNLSITDLEQIIQTKQTDFTTLATKQPKQTILERLGVNVWDSSLSGVDGIKAPNLSGIQFEYVEEGQEAQNGFNSVESLQYNNNTVSGVMEFQSSDFQNKTPEELNLYLLEETKEAIHNAIFKQLVTKIEDLTATSGYTAIDTAKTYSLSDFNTLEADNTGEYSELKYLMSSQSARKLKVTDSGYNMPILHNRLINDIQTFVRDEVNNSNIILADFSKSGVMVHGINILSDPYTKSNLGLLLMRVTAKADVKLLSETAFSIGKNFE